MKEKNSWLGVSVTTLFIGFVFLFLISPVIISKFSKAVQIGYSLFSLPVFFLAAVLIPCSIFHGKNVLKELGIKPFRVNDIAPVLSAIPIYILFAVLLFAGQMIWGELTPQFLVAYAQTCPNWQFILILITAGLIAPMAEELVFRRTLSGYLGKYVPPGQGWIVYVVPSLLFALIHGFLWQSVLLFFLALYLQWHQLHGSTTRSILIHALFNWCTLTVLVLYRMGILPVK